MNYASHRPLPHFTPAGYEWLSRHRLRLLTTFSLVLLPLILFGKLAEDVIEKEPFRWDTPFLYWLHAQSTPALDRWMLLTSWLGGLTIMLPLVAIVALFLCSARQRFEAWFLTFAVGGACLLNFCAKLAFMRQRPTLWLALTPEFDYGFPSGHAMLSTAVVAALLYVLWRSDASRFTLSLATIFGVTFALLVGLSRLYLGVHYPSDVIAGCCTSLAWVTGIKQLFALHQDRSGPHSHE